MVIPKTPNSNKKRSRYMAVPAKIINSLSSNSLKELFFSLKHKSTSLILLKLWLLLLFIFGFLGMSKMHYFNFDHFRSTSNPCVVDDNKSNNNNNNEISSSQSLVNINKKMISNDYMNNPFWEQPDNMGYKPCLNFSDEYKKDSEQIIRNRVNYLIVVVAGGLCQQRYQIIDGVVIARILGCVLVIPILQVNVIWDDESEFADIFDLDHFKSVLENDVKIVSSLPSTYLSAKKVEVKQTPMNVTPEWIRSHYLKKFGAEGVLVIRGIDSRLTPDLPSDLQKLRCKVDFEALRFAPRIVELGNKFTERMKSKGPYLALHLRMEIDVWVRTGCLPGVPEYDKTVREARKARLDLLTSRSNMTFAERKLIGYCPLNSIETMRLLKALEAPTDAKIFWAGGDPLGGKKALDPLTKEYPYMYSKEDLAMPGELEPFAKKASSLAAIDFIVCYNSDVFMPSHGGNFGKTLLAHRAFAGHKKSISPNKKHLPPLLVNSTLSEEEFNKIVKRLHRHSYGGPREKSGGKAGMDLLKYSISECMCTDIDVKRLLESRRKKKHSSKKKEFPLEETEHPLKQHPTDDIQSADDIQSTTDIQSDDENQSSDDTQSADDVQSTEDI